ncbi:hypothetical protein KKF84_00635 [Myxococcota bacterium]|nr:hypothetical protein [Myxococcota bacterium]MBU1533790.1 hypothetical protein [Myxococcota bacterium]
MMRKILLPLLLTLFMLSCMDEVDVNIVEPAPGATFVTGEEVHVKVTSDVGPILINDEIITGKNRAEVHLPPVDGLGFIKASKLHDPLVSVRSYLQGAFTPISEFNASTIKTRLGVDILNNNEVSFALLCAEMMEGEELVEYMDNPLQVETEIAFIPVTITVTTQSVIAPSIEVTLYFVDDVLYFYSLLHDVVITYNAKAAGLDSSGQAYYEFMEVSGKVVLTPDDSDLVEMTASASEPDITDDGGIPQAAFSPIIDALNEKVLEAIAGTTRNSSRVVFNTLMRTLVPQVVLEFTRPISQETRVETLDVVPENIFLSYGTLVQAIEPVFAKPHHGVLKRTHSDDDVEHGMTITFGSPLVNQIAFAIWDAGNTNNIVYSRNELYELGMERLGGNYDKLRESEINLALPPILEWEADGPWLVMGGIEITMRMDGVADTKATTAGKVPVYFQQHGNAMMLMRDETREVFFYDVGFDRMSGFVDYNKVIKLLQTAVPGVVSDLFSSFPIIKMTSSQLPMLNGDPGPQILTVLNGVETRSNFWKMQLSFQRLQ